MKDKYRKLLDKAYELEGLLHLALSRDEKEQPGGLFALIEKKVSDINDIMAERMEPKTELKADMREPESKSELPKAEHKTKHEMPKGEPKQKPTEQKPPRRQFTERKQVIPEETVKAVKEEFSPFYNLDEEETPTQQLPKWPQKRDIKNKPKFSLNDRFLFTRELFGGDGKAFNEAIDKLTTFSNLSEAESYFVRTLSLDPDNNETHDSFLRMVTAYFA